MSYVDNDNRGGALLATGHLLGLGRRRVGTVTGPLDMPAAIDRLAGYHEALRIAGVRPEPALESEGAFTQESGVDAMRRLLASAPISTACSWPPTSWRQAPCRSCRRPVAACPGTSP